MKVKETFTSFTGYSSYGKYAFFVDVNPDGVYIDVKELSKQASHFPRVVIIGKPFYDKEEIAKFIKWTTKANPLIFFEIYTPGIIRPIKIGSFTNVEYNVVLQLKRSGISYEDRINPSAVSWFNEMGANFIFEVDNDDDVDEAKLLINEFGIPKSKVILAPVHYDVDVEFIMSKARINTYNFALPMRETLWNKLGRE